MGCQKYFVEFDRGDHWNNIMKTMFRNIVYIKLKIVKLFLRHSDC